MDSSDLYKGRLSLTFKCVVQDGEGAFNRMVFPGKEQVSGAPEDWPGPEQMAPGSLNCRVTELPDNLYELAGEGDRIQALDAGRFEPEFLIPGNLIQNNRLHPTPGNPRRGTAQVWRCAVRNENTGETFDAWHTRRIDGTYPPFHGIIELMADRKLRDAHGLTNGTPLTVTMYAKSVFPDNPLVMAYIGNDDPNRGDSKAAVGISQVVAEMLNGRYVYVDEAMLTKNFLNSGGIDEKLRAYIKQNGRPDIVIGMRGDDFDYLKETPTLVVRDVSESLSRDRTKDTELVPHHLTHEMLNEEGEEFKKRYPDIKKPLIAVMMGGYIYESQCKSFADQLFSIIKSAYPEATVFLCPSRRTADNNYTIAKCLKQNMPIAKRLKNCFRNIASGNTGGARKALSSNIDIININYNKAVAKYNPYPGLLANADHIIVFGDSYSLVSEALFTGKNIYLGASWQFFTDLKAKGYISSFSDLEIGKPFPTKPIDAPNVTRQIAASIVEEYKEKLAATPPAPHYNPAPRQKYAA